MSLLPLILVCVLFAATLWRPSWAFAVVVMMFPLEMLLQATVPYFLNNAFAFNVAVAGLALLSIVRRWLGGESPVIHLFTGAFLASWGFYAWGYLSTIWSPAEGEALDLAVQGLPYWILLMLLAPMMICRIEELRTVVQSLLLVGLAIGLMIILSPDFNIVAGRLSIRLVGGDRTNPLQIGTLGGTLMIIGALTMLTRWTPWQVALRVAAVVIGAGVALLSGSRGQMVLAVLTIIVTIPLAYRVSNLRGFVLTTAAAVVVVVGTMFAASLFISWRNDDRWDAQSLVFGGAGRLDNVVDLFAAYLSSPGHWVQGLGVSAFRELDTRSGDDYSHVLLADALAEAGIIGAAILGTVLVLGWRQGRDLFVAVRHDHSSRIDLSVILAITLYYLLLSNKQGSMLGTPLLFGLLILIGRLHREYFSRPEEPMPPEGASVDVESARVPMLAGR